MAATAANKPDRSGGGEDNDAARRQRLGRPSNNPLPLSASQEAQVRDVFNARVRKQCAEEIQGSSLCPCPCLALPCLASPPKGRKKKPMAAC